MTECKHGQLARSCHICELEAEIERLRGVLQAICDYAGQRGVHPVDKARMMWQIAYDALHGDDDDDDDDTVKAALDAAGDNK